MPLFLTTHSAPGLSPDEFAQNTPIVLEQRHASFRQLFVNMREGFIVTVYEAADQDALEREFERVGFPWNEMHAIDFQADEAALRAPVPA